MQTERRGSSNPNRHHQPIRHPVLGGGPGPGRRTVPQFEPLMGHSMRYTPPPYTLLSHHELSMCSTEWASACMPQPMQQQQVLDHVLQYSTERNDQSLLPVLRHPRKLALAPYPHPTFRVPLPRQANNLPVSVPWCRNLGVARASRGMSEVDNGARRERRFEVGGDEEERRRVGGQVKRCQPTGGLRFLGKA